MAEGEGNRIVTGEGAAYPCDTWADLVHTEGAEVFARFEGGFDLGQRTNGRVDVGRERFALSRFSTSTKCRT